MSRLDSPQPLRTLISICYPTLMSIENKLKIEKKIIMFNFHLSDIVYIHYLETSFSSMLVLSLNRSWLWFVRHGLCTSYNFGRDIQRQCCIYLIIICDRLCKHLSLSLCSCNLFVKPENRTGDSCYDYRTLFLDVQGKSAKYKRQPFNNHRNNTNNDIVKV